MYYVILSSLIYLIAFIYPAYLCVGVFLWMLPVLVTDKEYDYGFKEGYVWGLLFFSGHLSWFAHIIYNKGQGDARICVYVITVLYFALFSGFWLWFKQLLVYRLVRQVKNHKGKCVALWSTWVISTVTFIYLTCYCSLALLDCFEGYPFINPLLPLVSWSWYLRPIYCIGTLAYWIIILLVNLTLASLIKRFDSKSLTFLIALLCFPLFFQDFKLLQPIHFNEDEIEYLKPAWNGLNLTQAEQFYQIGRQLDSIALRNPDVKLVLLPESSFSYNLIDWESRLSAWRSLFKEDVSIIIGSHRYRHGKIYNCMYHIVNGKIVALYDKSHLMPLVERMPWILKKLKPFDGLFTKPENVFSYPVHDQADLFIAGFVPYICSELFCEGRKPIAAKPILFICNDSWLALPYAQDLGKRFVKLYTMRYQVNVLYVGSYALHII